MIFLPHNAIKLRTQVPIVPFIELIYDLLVSQQTNQFFIEQGFNSVIFFVVF
jgi:hypothetical protein